MSRFVAAAVSLCEATQIIPSLIHPVTTVSNSCSTLLKPIYDFANPSDCLVSVNKIWPWSASHNN